MTPRAPVALAALVAAAACGSDPWPADCEPVGEELDPESGWALRVRQRDTGIGMVLIRPGRFVMGAPSGEPGRLADEVRHEVRIRRPFYLGETEVTQAQWRTLMEDRGWLFSGDDRPAGGLSWDDAAAFVARLNARVGEQVYRLPTEAEWEYACRAGSGGAFHWGDEPSARSANFRGRAAEARPGDDPGRPVLGIVDWWRPRPRSYDRLATTPVGAFVPNAWGLHDMHGNVWEWCADWYGPYPRGPVVDPRGPARGERRVLRGGSTLYDARFCRAAYRFSYPPSRPMHCAGLRIVRELTSLETTAE